MNKKSLLSAFLTATLFAGLFLASATHFGTVQASTDVNGIPKPSVPEFNVTLVDSSYVTPSTNTTDPYTGQTVTHPSQHIEARTIEIRIKNVAFTLLEIENGYTAGFYYNIRWKGHSEEEWHVVCHSSDGFLSRDSGAETVFSCQGEYSSTEGLTLTTQVISATFPPNAQIDFQVEAMIGFIQHRVTSTHSYDVFEGETSGWSNTQTITISEGQTPTYPPANPELVNTILGVIIVAVILGAPFGLLIYFTKRK